MNQEDQEAWGQLTAIDLHGFDKNLLSNKKKLAEFSLKLCEKIGMEPYGRPIVKKFGQGNLYGYSMMQFIETSSITVHLDEHGGRAFVDVFSCKKFDVEAAKNFSKEFFKAGKVNCTTILRG